jgi:hypothetical protein
VLLQYGRTGRLEIDIAGGRAAFRLPSSDDSQLPKEEGHPREETDMAERRRVVAAVQVLLTLTAIEFFGPIVRDFNSTHALNPGWVGHARVQ